MPRLYFHPQRGAVVTERALDGRWLRYRGGSDGDWRVLGDASARLPKGFLRGNPSKQRFGMGGPLEVLGPLEKRCRDCGVDFVFTAAEQKHWYETLGFFVDVTAVRCAPCRQARRRVEEARVRYADALRAGEPGEAARAALALEEAGGRARLDRAIGHARRAGDEALVKALQRARARR